MRRVAWLWLWAWAAGGCAASAGVVDPADAGSADAAVDSAEPDAAVADAAASADAGATSGPAALAQCDAQRVWWTADMQVYTALALPPYVGFSPNAGMLFRDRGYLDPSGQYLRVASGQEMMADVPDGVVHARDAYWGREVRVTSEGVLRVATVLTRRTLLEVAPEASHWWTVAALAEDGAVVAAAQCDETGVAVHAFTVDGGAERASTRFDGVGCSAYDNSPLLAVAGRDTVLVAMPGDTSLYRLDLVSGARTSVPVVLDPVDPNLAYPNGPVLALTVSPDGTRVATAATDGRVRVWSLPDLRPVGAPVAAGSALLNQYVYAPSRRVSPLAFSPGGELLAFVRDDASVGMLRVADGTVLGRMLPPDDAWPDQPGRAFTAASMAFSPDGSLLAISYEGGTALWSCPGHVFPAAAESLTVTMAAPTSATVGQPVALEATHMGTEHVHSHQFFVDGVALGPASLERTASWTPDAAGRHHVTVVIDDGIDTGRAETVVSVP